MGLKKVFSNMESLKVFENKDIMSQFILRSFFEKLSKCLYNFFDLAQTESLEKCLNLACNEISKDCQNIL